MRLVSGAKYADLLSRYQRMSEARETADKLAAERLSTITRLTNELSQHRDAHPDSPAPQPQPVQGDAELRRQLHLARRAMRELSAQLRDAQQANVSLTADLHDLRQGGAS